VVVMQRVDLAMAAGRRKNRSPKEKGPARGQPRD
jgi:hypothetical protein